ncbi:RHTO0S01e03532g1_1 [Rhodotorula toruloides]|uniref:RHTO0S01e03532g1_1 n=1 Tax=Rhodotorula toruloides TaxID=5286 RepID=A0A061AEQ3_RHOTO|nr:putative transporter [Rhodotorula toruloides]CDR35625.1 RHTO0S01e03532g1_1 [Rhodotorula toruloides]
MSTTSSAGVKEHDAEKGQFNATGLAYAVKDIDENSSDEELLAYQISPQETRSLLRRLDSFLAPMVMILYLISFLDRSNIGNASTGGMFVDIGAPKNGLSVTTSIFYATYVSFEPMWTTLLKSARPSVLLPAVTTVWGAVVLGNGFIHNYASLVALRLVLGFLESALTPCLFLILTFYYQRMELAWRTSLMFVSAATSGVVGGLIGAGFLKLDGRLGLEGWRHLYIWEGAITILIGFASIFFIADSPASAWYLSPRQKLLMRVRDLQARQYTGADAFSWAEVRKAFTEPIVYLSGLTQLGFDICLYGFSTFIVVIVKALGYSTINSQLLTAPIYAWAAIVYLAAAHICDKKDVRYWLILPLGLVTCIGYILLVAVQHSTAVSLFACFLCGTGIYTAVGINVSWLNSNIAGVRKRSTAIGIQQLIGNIGGVIAGQIYRSQDKPHYRLGHAVSLGSMAFGLAMMTVMTWLLRHRNAKKLALTEAEKEEQDRQGVTGDAHWSFMYVW